MEEEAVASNLQPKWPQGVGFKGASQNINIINQFLCMDDSETHQEIRRITVSVVFFGLVGYLIQKSQFIAFKFAVLVNREDTICKKKMYSYYFCKINKT